MSDHYYDPIKAEPRHFVPKKDGTGNRPTTIRDAKANGWVPSVTTILKVLAKPQLERWKMVQAATAVLTSPRINGENLDSFMERVLFQDKEQDEEAAAAADRGTAIHAEMENLLNGNSVSAEMAPWVEPAFQSLSTGSLTRSTEQILVGDGYAGKTDLIICRETHDLLVDFKSAKKLPEKGSWSEHRLQLSAYAAAYQKKQIIERPIRTANLYISTVECGRFMLWENPDWQIDFDRGFAPLVKVWRWQNGF